MTSIASTALSGMNAAQAQLNVAAHNVANQSVAGFRRQVLNTSARPDGGVQTDVTVASVAGAAPEADVVAQLVAKNSFLANLAVFKTQDQMAGVLLDQKA